MSPTPKRHGSWLVISLAGWGLGWLAITSVWLWIQAPVRDAPPYNEYAETIWTESAFLAETRFDYDRLTYHEPQIEEGGVRSYNYIIVPGILAWLLQRFPPSDIFAGYRAMNACLASAIILWTFAQLRRSHGVGRAVLVTAAVFTLPFFVVGVEMLSLEFPLTAVLVASAQAYSRRHHLLAGVLAWLAFFIKPTALPFTAALTIAIGLTEWARGGPRSARQRGWSLALLLLIVSLLVQWRILAFFGRDAQLSTRRPLLGPLIFFQIACFLSPYLIPIVGVSAWVQWRYWRAWARRRSAPFLERARRLIRVVARRRPIELLTAIYVPGVLATFALATFLPRYLISLSPFLAILLADSLFRRFKTSTWAYRFLVCLVLYGIFSPFGHLMLPIVTSDYSARGWVSMERSLEYRADLESTRAACDWIEKHATAEPVLVGKLMTHLLSSRYLGYVDEPIAGYTVVDNFHMGRLAPALQMLDDKPASLLVVSVAQGDYQMPRPDPRSPNDEVLWQDLFDPPLMIHRHRFTNTVINTEHRAYYLRLLEDNDAPFIRCSMLASRGYDRLGKDELMRRYLRTGAAPHHLRWLANRLREMDSPKSADAIEALLPNSPKRKSEEDEVSLDPKSAEDS